MNSKMKAPFLGAVLTILAGCRSDRGQANRAPVILEKPDVTLESVQIGERRVRFYVDFGQDSAVLGFSFDELAGRRYFPMYGSTYAGLPSVTMDVFVSKSGEEMWVRSSWKGYETLAYHRIGTDRAMTTYGEMASFSVPTPAALGGHGARFPEMDASRVSRVATVRYDEAKR